MTMRELAKIANVSVSTVSKAFHDAQDVSPETKRYIFQLAKKHGCYGKFYKERFSKPVIAILCPELISNYYVSFVEKLQDLIEQNCGVAVISTFHFDNAKQEELIEYYASYLHVDGIITCGLMVPLKKGYDIPIVSLFSSIDKNVDAVKSDIATGMKQAFERLHSLGHRHIAFIGETLTSSKRDCFSETALSFPDVHTYFFTSRERFEKAGQIGIRNLLKENSPVTAIICAYDDIAIGVIKELKENGFSVPKDFSVIGIDNIHAAAYFEPTLTSIDVHADEMCAVVWNLLSQKQKNKFFHSRQKIIISTDLVVRESIGQNCLSL